MSEQSTMSQQSKPQPKKSKPLLILGTILIIVGISLSVLSAIPATDSQVLFDQTFQVPGFHYYCFTSMFYSTENVLHINFNLVGEGTVDFFVMNEANFLKYNSSQTFVYYPAPSAENVAAKSVDWSVEAGQTLYFVWDNSESSNSKTVSALFILDFPGSTISPLLSFLGLPLLFTGLSLIGLGYRPFVSPSSRNEILVGYVFAILGGIIGLAIGYSLTKKENPEDKFHGQAILAIGVLAFILYIASIFV